MTTPVDFTSAQSILQSYLAGYGLGNLATWAWDLLQKNPGMDTATFETKLYETPEFQARFPAFNALRAAGKGISVDAYQEYERTVRQSLQTWGIPEEMYGTRDSIKDLLLKDVSPAEVNYRIQRAAEAAYSAPEETRQALQNLYGIDSGGMIAYWLDPDRAQPILERQYAAAQIAGAANRMSLSVDAAEAERLASLGITEAQANQGFAEVSSYKGLTTGMGETVTQADLVGATFGTDAESAQKVERVVKGRTGQFQQSGGAAESQQGVVGLQRQ